ncbi:MAG: hypothetical protein QG654_274 [Patescibacteria group bacterium]|nr:hypothetical protein [Patescibacteria group bacterium]
MSKKERIFLFQGLTSKHTHILEMFWNKDSPSVHYRPQGSSQKAFPSSEEMSKIEKLAPCIIFPLSGQTGLPWSFAGEEFSIDFIDEKPCSIIFLDSGIKRVRYRATSIPLIEVATEVLITDGSVEKVSHILSDVSQQQV